MFTLTPFLASCLAIDFGDLGAFEGKVVHQTLIGEDKADDRLLHGITADFFGGAEFHNRD